MLARAIGKPQERVRLARRLGIDHKLAGANNQYVGDLGVGNRHSCDRDRRSERVRSPNRKINSRYGVRLNSGSRGCDLRNRRTLGDEDSRCESEGYEKQLGGDFQTCLRIEMGVVMQQARRGNTRHRFFVVSNFSAVAFPPRYTFTTTESGGGGGGGARMMMTGAGAAARGAGSTAWRLGSHRRGKGRSAKLREDVGRRCAPRPYAVRITVPAEDELDCALIHRNRKPLSLLGGNAERYAGRADWLARSIPLDRRTDRQDTHVLHEQLGSLLLSGRVGAGDHDVDSTVRLNQAADTSDIVNRDGHRALSGWNLELDSRTCPRRRQTAGHDRLAVEHIHAGHTSDDRINRRVRANRNGWCRPGCHRNSRSAR